MFTLMMKQATQHQTSSECPALVSDEIYKAWLTVKIHPLRYYSMNTHPSVHSNTLIWSYFTGRLKFMLSPDLYVNYFARRVIFVTHL